MFQSDLAELRELYAAEIANNFADMVCEAYPQAVEPATQYIDLLDADTIQYDDDDDNEGFINDSDVKHRTMQRFDHRQTENNVSEYIAQDLSMDCGTPLEFCENEERLERAQRNFVKGLIALGAMDAEELE